MNVQPNDLVLKAGLLSMLFERDSGFLRYVVCGDRELIRGVYGAVRDRNWNTIAPRVAMRQEEVRAAGFHLVFEVEHRHEEIHFAWRGEVSGDENGRIEYTMRGEAHSDFQSNRIGFCVLHPMHLQSKPCVIEHADGSRTETRFPAWIAPHQPFGNVRAIEHRAGNVAVRVAMNGAIFETEDQRNWTDASFKTYCRPLSQPFPFGVARGETWRQSVEITARNLPASPRQSARSKKIGGVDIELLQSPRQLSRPIALPRIGLQLAAGPHDERQIEALRKLKPAHLRVDLNLSRDFGDALESAAQTARLIGAPLEIALLAGDDFPAELERLVRVLARVQPDVARYFVFHQRTAVSSRALTEATREALSATRFAAALGGGSDANFAELNRNRRALQGCDFASYSLNPQVHAFDARSMTETLPCQEATLRSARRFCRDKPLLVSTVTLLPRFNAVASGENAPHEAPADSRQPSLFTAQWTLGSLRFLAQGGAHSATFFETSGRRGVMDESGVFPVFRVFETACEYSRVVATRSGAPLEVESLMLQNEAESCLLLANFTREERRVRLARRAVTATMEVLDAQSVWRSCGEKDLRDFSLPPQGVARMKTKSRELEYERS